MADEDKLVKAGVEAALKPFADLLEKLAGPAAAEIGLTLKDHVREFRFKRQLRLFQRTKEMLEEAGIEPKIVPFKLLGPIMESGSLEEDDILQDKWAALLSRAASGDNDAVHPSFIEILKQISALEAQFLDALYSLRDDDGPRGKGKVDDRQVITIMFPALKNELSTREQREQIAYLLSRFDESGLHLNLDRIGLVKIERLKADVFWYEMTRFGRRFVETCQSPKRAQRGQSAASTSSSE
jgi:hypothetical protein